MGIKHAKKTIGLVQASLGREIPFFISYYKFGGTKGSKGVYQKGKDIAAAFKTQGEVLIEFRAYFEQSDAVYMTTQAFIEGLPLTFSAIELEVTINGGRTTQRVSEDFLKPTLGSPGILFRSYGYLEEAEIVAEVGQFILVRCVLRTLEFYPGKKLL